MKITVNDHLYNVMICAVRYCLGRRTYMPDLVTSWIIANFDGRMDEQTAKIMLTDIEDWRKLGERIGKNMFGDKCDIEVWEKFEGWLRKQVVNSESD